MNSILRINYETKKEKNIEKMQDNELATNFRNQIRSFRTFRSGRKQKIAQFSV